MAFRTPKAEPTKLIDEGDVLDAIEGADIEAYIKTMQRLRQLPVNVVHGGHDPSFGQARLHQLVDHYLRGADRP